MSEPFLVPYDPRALDQRAAVPLDLEPLQGELEEHEAARMHALIGMLPALERALCIEHLSGRSYASLAKAWGVSKEAVRRRVRRARQRLAWLAHWPGIDLSIADVETVCTRHLSRGLRATVLAYWPRADGQMRTQAEVGKRYGISQSAVQLRLVRATEQLNACAEQDEEAAPVAHALVMLIATTSSLVLRDASTKHGRRALKRVAQLSTED